MNQKSKVSILGQIFIRPDKICSILIKKLAPNDDSGRHGVVVPKESYPMFPSFMNFNPEAKINYTNEVITIWKIGANPCEEKSGNFKHYHRYPERRLTRLKTEINDLSDESIMVIGKRSDLAMTYEIHFFDKGQKYYQKIIQEFGIDVKEKSSYFIDLCWTFKQAFQKESRLSLFLKKFDKINAMGFVESLRSGDTGIGYTFEKLMGLEENNYSGPDFEGIELKCYSLGKGDKIKKNLFLKEPEWVDGINNGVKRIEQYGYFDNENQRQALYSSVTSKQNSHGFKLTVNRNEKKVYLDFKGIPVAYWSFDILKKRLDEKLTEAIFIGAKVKKGTTLQYYYETIAYCSNPYIDSFLSIMESGNIIVEIRMHVDEKGGIRNHGTGFRIPESQLSELYAKVQKLR